MTAKSNPDWVTVWTDAILQERGKLSTGAVQPFDALMAFLRESGRDEAAGDVGIAKEHKITDNIKMMASLHKSGKHEITNHLGITKEREIPQNIRKSARKTGPLFHAVHLAWRWVIRTLVGNRHDHV